MLSYSTIINVPGAVLQNLYDLKHDPTAADLYLIGYNSPFTSNYNFLNIYTLNSEGVSSILSQMRTVDGFDLENKPKNFEISTVPSHATLFNIYEAAKFVADKLVELHELRSEDSTVKFRPDILQIKNICEQYYCITHYDETYQDVKTSKEWLFNPLDYTERNSINSAYNTVHHYYFKLNDYDKFAMKLRECKLDCINVLQNKILTIQQRKPEDLLI